MAINDATKYLKYANVQMAAESYFGLQPESANVGQVLQNIQGDMLIPLIINGNTRSSKFTSTAAADFATKWSIVEHLSDTATGFSGTLFRARQDDPTQGIKAGELVLSFRSTEFIDDAARDNKATNELEVKKFGWAFGQIADMEDWYQNLKATGKIPASAQVSVTGYSLGGHLATAFNLIRQDKAELTDVAGTYTFNGAGVGKLNSGQSLSSIIDTFDTDRSSGASFTDSKVQSLYAAFASRYNDGRTPTQADIDLAYLQTLPGPDPTGTLATNKDEARTLYDALVRVKQVADEASRVPSLANTKGKPADIIGDKIAGTKLNQRGQRRFFPRVSRV